MSGIVPLADSAAANCDFYGCADRQRAAVWSAWNRSASGLTKRFDHVTAVSDVSFDVGAGL